MNGGPPGSSPILPAGGFIVFAWSPDREGIGGGAGDDTSDVVLLREEK